MTKTTKLLKHLLNLKIKTQNIKIQTNELFYKISMILK